MESDPKDKRLEIKKYPNRRYYDATHSRHLTLDEIRTLIQQGYDLRVVDAPTGADITAQVLTQIILELDTPKVDSLPVPLLMRLIRMNDQLVKDFIEKYFNQALKSFLDYQQQVEEQIRRTHGLPSLFPSVSAWTKAMLGPLAAGFASRPQEPSTPAAQAAAPADTAEMQRRLRELETQNERLRRKRGRKKPVRRPKKGR
ncbi:MAG TPA: polyhydroxyalkanoate synthesis regulator DNA-binding domain-containing protein [Verrucomicrobiae bacterium]|nr:polyhydroxyalkanoate synthesis regulator DNA-binding domain-containing protein [Verrucomicrobiae bacterium]